MSADQEAGREIHARVLLSLFLNHPMECTGGGERINECNDAKQFTSKPQRLPNILLNTG